MVVLPGDHAVRLAMRESVSQPYESSHRVSIGAFLRVNMSGQALFIRSARARNLLGSRTSEAAMGLLRLLSALARP